MKTNKRIYNQIFVEYEDPRLAKLMSIPISNTSIKKAKEIWKSHRVALAVQMITSPVYSIGAMLSECVYDYSPDDYETAMCILWLLNRAGYEIKYIIEPCEI